METLQIYIPLSFFLSKSRLLKVLSASDYVPMYSNVFHSSVQKKKKKIKKEIEMYEI